MFSKMKHFLSMGIMLLMQTILISLMVGYSNESFWFSYILFLVFLGGMLVMFIYVISLSSNEMFSSSSNLYFIILISMFMFMVIFFMTDLNLLMDSKNLETNLFMNLESKLLMEENSIYLIKIYNNSTNLITLFLINYLFLTLIISVKITNFFYGPLRPSSN
uniref:NADH dehydrogenase subunit 6 n=1 Tax=Allodia protenta TaxID=1891807 RepID=UPI001EDF6720|nr:NADH dehydrogenase subunit 6 [Allodia protenta]UIP57106.1 NADH dehydrogenase subunit 6 [Allodia protenta]